MGGLGFFFQFFRKFMVLALVISVFHLSGCRETLLTQNKKTYEEKCLAEGFDKGSIFFSQCVQKLFYKDEDKYNAEKLLSSH